MISLRYWLKIADILQFIFYKDNAPPHLSLKTCQKLLKFIDQRGACYDLKIKEN